MEFSKKVQKASTDICKNSQTARISKPAMYFFAANSCIWVSKRTVLKGLKKGTQRKERSPYDRGYWTKTNVDQTIYFSKLERMKMEISSI